jgi:hypothetical protein
VCEPPAAVTNKVRKGVSIIVIDSGPIARGGA